MNDALKYLFEESITFRLQDGNAIDGSVFIGSTEVSPVNVLRDDPTAYKTEFEAWFDDWMRERKERRDAILVLFGNSKRYADLSSALRRGQLIPFVGSGMSVPTELPTWSKLLRSIRSFTRVPERRLEALLKKYRFEEAADLLASDTNSRLFNERIEHELRIDEVERIRGAVRLLPAIFTGTVITTNLDNILELLYEDCELDFTSVLAGTSVGELRKIKVSNGRYLLKLHGHCADPKGRVLLTSEYDASYTAGSPVREELSLIYQMHNLLFLGCSLGVDRTVELIAEVAGRDAGMPKHYAFLSCPSDTRERVIRENELTLRGIYPIWYDGDHDDSISALLAGLLEVRMTSNTGGAGR